MEDNKPFMPPPPPKMPPPPPRTDVQTSPQMVKDEEIAPAVEEINPLDEMENLQEETQVVKENEIAVQQEEQMVKEIKEKKKISVATILYWAGFGLCLIGIGFSIFFLVK